MCDIHVVVSRFPVLLAPAFKLKINYNSSWRISVVWPRVPCVSRSPLSFHPQFFFAFCSTFRTYMNTNGYANSATSAATKRKFAAGVWMYQ